MWFSLSKDNEMYCQEYPQGMGLIQPISIARHGDKDEYRNTKNCVRWQRFNENDRIKAWKQSWSVSECIQGRVGWKCSPGPSSFLSAQNLATNLHWQKTAQKRSIAASICFQTEAIQLQEMHQPYYWQILKQSKKQNQRISHGSDILGYYWRAGVKPKGLLLLSLGHHHQVIWSWVIISPISLTYHSLYNLSPLGFFPLFVGLPLQPKLVVLVALVISEN